MIIPSDIANDIEELGYAAAEYGNEYAQAWQRVNTWLQTQAATPVADVEGVVWEQVEEGEITPFLKIERDIIWVKSAGTGESIGAFLPPHIRLRQRRPHAQQDSQQEIGDE